MSEQQAQPYLALSELAGRERWCWNLGCTTCGCMHLRQGLACVGLGLHPDDPEWPIHRRSTGTPPVLADMDWWRPDAGLQARVANEAAAVSLDDLSDRVPFPDWLGHLGVVLQGCAESEARDAVLSRSIVAQAREKLGPEMFPGRDPADPAMPPLAPTELEAIESVWRVHGVW